MDFRFECFYLMYIFNYIVVGSSELQLHAMTLGHSSLLIYWHPTKVNATSDRLTLTYKALTSKQGASNQTAVDDTLKSISFYKEFLEKGQYRLDDLNEDTEYEITMALNEATVQKNYTVKCKTNLKNNSPPEKPYFTWDVDYYFYHNKIIITWVPCGKERNCRGKEAGTHFAVKYKVLESQETATIIQYSGLKQEIADPYYGRMYEVIVISINGNSETPSDPQTIFLQPCSSPIHSLKVLTFTNTSIYVSWKQPKRITTGENTMHGYVLLGFKPPNKISELHTYPSDLYKSTSLQQVRLYDLEPNISYTFLIVPYCGKDFGSEYRFDYSIEAIQTNLPLAKPDFKFIPLRHIKPPYPCVWNIVWVLCPEISDCKNLNFGSDCEIKIQNGNDTRIYNCRGVYEIVQIELERDKNYVFIGKSVNEFNQTSESVTKQISCDMVGDE